jgi:hypothetical protein
MRRTPLQKKSKSEVKKLQDELWELCKQIIRKKYGNICYTCDKENLSGSNWHTGHMIAKASLGAHLKYDLRVLRPQCYHCNVNLGGSGAEFYRRMVERDGKKYVDKIYKEKQILIKVDTSWYKNKIEEYKIILEKLNE